MNLAPENFNLSVRKIANLLLLIGFTLIVLIIGNVEKKQEIKKDGSQKQEETKVSVASQCLNNQNYDCYIKAFKGLYDSDGPELTLNTLAQLSAENDLIKRDCHPYAHELGRYSFNQIGDALKAFSYGQVICASGYYHGVMEGFLTRVRNEQKDLGAEIVNLCDAKSDDTRFMAFQCLHGLGHGLTMYFQGDIMKSLPYCDKLKTSWDMQSCQGGVFMENIVVKDQPGHKSLYLRSDEPEYPCNAVSENHKFSCYYLISSWFLQLTSYDYKQAFAMCDGIRSDFVWVCYQSMGRDISGSTLRDPKRSEEICGQGKAGFYTDCIIGVVKDFTNTTAETSEGANFCKIVRSDSKSRCYQSGGQILNDIYKSEQDFSKACAQLTYFEPAYKQDCLQDS